MINDPYRDPWRRLFNRGAPVEEPEPQAPVQPTAATSAWDRLMRQPAVPAALPQPPAGMRTYDERLVAQAAPAFQQPTARSPRVARFQALVAQGIIDPRNILGSDGRVRPDINALLDEQPGYRGVAPEAGGEPGGFEFINPDELRHAEWLMTHTGLENERNVQRSGMYTDPVTGQTNVTTKYGGELLDRFGTARRAEEQYRQQVEQARGATLGPQGAYEAAMAREQQVAMEQVPGRANIVDEQRLAAANRAREQALMAYNRARGVERNVGPNPAFTIEELGRGMTPEQLTAAGLAAGAGYSTQEQEEIASGRMPSSARTKPYEDYLRAARARGVI